MFLKSKFMQMYILHSINPQIYHNVYLITLFMELYKILLQHIMSNLIYFVSLKFWIIQSLKILFINFH